jgi:integrase/recombinase XerD
MVLTTETHQSIPSYSQALNIRDQIIWQGMDQVTVNDAVMSWLEEIPNKLTKKNYLSAMNRLVGLGLVDIELSLQAFALIQHSEILKKIKQQPGSEATNQARAAAYISFTRHLAEKYEGNFKRANPSRDPKAKTFRKIRDVVDTEAMTFEQWTAFLTELKKINQRDCLIAKIALQGGKRINEVLSLVVDQIDKVKCQITFEQSKTGGRKKQVIITYPASLMNELLAYIGSRQGLVFVTRTGNKLLTQQVANTFAMAGLQAAIPFKVTPHVLRASCVTYLKKMGMSDTDIMKVTGHSDAEMVAAYDKSDRADNASKKVNLIC